jgi:hypothetical protein
MSHIVRYKIEKIEVVEQSIYGNVSESIGIETVEDDGGVILLIEKTRVSD